MKKSLYTSAAQIKLLADAPEQVDELSLLRRHQSVMTALTINATLISDLAKY